MTEFINGLKKAKIHADETGETKLLKVLEPSAQEAIDIAAQDQ